ncbi:LamG-like jellyroll fold domain-containing protein [Promicromonospora sp. NPDC023805]|uniref:LamG-like jellyroll fold domain-containing protein n=1 Tax=Promicromonospora sp. NPDC023805 TaxID=3154696 RepID=UPI0033F0DBDD
MALADDGPASQPAVPSFSIEDTQQDAERSSLDRALDEAAQTGQRVELLAQRGESREVFALPDGTLEEVSYAVPRWARSQGGWARVDTELAVENGTVRPVASTVGLELSAGGSDPLVRMSRHGRVVELTWPGGDLPRPVLDGSTAVYPEVIDGVDLQMLATEDGFASHLIVKTPEAASSPALDEITFGLAGEGLEVTVASGGGLEAVDPITGSAVFVAPPPSMWEAGPTESGPEPATGSSVRAGREATTAAAAAEPQSDPGDDGSGQGRVAPVEVEVSASGDELSLVPDQELLEDPEATFPIIVDPQWLTKKPTAWTGPNEAYPTQSYWQFKGNSTEGLGTCQGWTGCADGSTYRLYWQFDISAYRGKSILSASFNVPNTHSAVCSDRPVHLYHTNAINQNTTWNTVTASGFNIARVGTESFSYGGSQAGCAPSATAEFPIRGLMQDRADANGSQLTLGLRADSESDKNHWKKFSKNASLRVQYNVPPDMVSTRMMSLEYGGMCAPHSDPAIFRTRGNMTVARASDDDGDSVRVEFRLQAWNGSAWAQYWTSGLVPSTGKASGSAFSVSMPSSVPQNGGSSAWTVRVYDGRAYSPWSDACFFKYDPNRPAAPKISSTTYPESNTEDPQDPWHRGVGHSGLFTFSSSSSDVVKFRYGINGNPRQDQERPASSPTIWVNPQNTGVHRVTVQAFDAAGNPSDIRTYLFRVGAGAVPVGAWTFDEGGTEYTPAGGAHLTEADSFSGSGLALDGAGDYVTSTVGRVNTEHTFSVEAWVKLDTLPHPGSIVVSQAATHKQGFKLYYQATQGRWMFGMYDGDTPDARPIVAVSDVPVRADEWTHLVGVHNNITRTVQLYVNGVGSEPRAANGFASTGPIMIGGAKYGSAAPDSFVDGVVDHVRTYARAVTEYEAAQLASAAAPEVASRWTFSQLDGASTPLRIGNEVPAGPDLVLAGGARVEADFGIVGEHNLLLSSDGSTPGAASTSGGGLPLDWGKSFTVTGYGGIPSEPVPAGGAMTFLSLTGVNEELIQVQAVPYEDPATSQGVVRWELKARAADSSSATVRTAVNGSNPYAYSQFHIAVTWDAPSKRLRLYVNGESPSGASPDGTGPVDGVVFSDPPDRLYLGRTMNAGSPVGVWPGAIDDVWLFNGALQQWQIDQLADTNDRDTVVPGEEQ